MTRKEKYSSDETIANLCNLNANVVKQECQSLEELFRKENGWKEFKENSGDVVEQLLQLHWNAVMMISESVRVCLGVLMELDHVASFLNEDCFDFFLEYGEQAIGDAEQSERALYYFDKLLKEDHKFDLDRLVDCLEELKDVDGGEELLARCRNLIEAKKVDKLYSEADLERATREAMEQAQKEAEIITEDYKQLEAKYLIEKRHRKQLQGALTKYENALQESLNVTCHDDLATDYQQVVNNFKHLQSKYEQFKTANKKYAQNEKILKDHIAQHKERFNILKTQANEKLKLSNKKIAALGADLNTKTAQLQKIEKELQSQTVECKQKNTKIGKLEKEIKKLKEKLNETEQQLKKNQIEKS